MNAPDALGDASKPVKLTNAAVGDVSAKSTDAVNGSQLFTANQNVSTLNDRVAGMGGMHCPN
jgi:autotransporter adhesin